MFVTSFSARQCMQGPVSLSPLYAVLPVRTKVTTIASFPGLLSLFFCITGLGASVKAGESLGALCRHKLQG